MPLFTSDSDKKFLCLLLLMVAAITAVFYFYVEKKSELLARQKQDGRYTGFVETYANEKYEMSMLGTSHTENVALEGVTCAPLSAPFSIPPVMYIKAKLIVKAHPEIKVVYLEADDHILFNGPVYNLNGLSPEEKRKSKVFEWGGAFIDSDPEAKAIFGEVTPSNHNNFLLLQDDVRPIILKRIVADIFKETPPVPLYKATADCSMSYFPKTVVLDQESSWSKLSASERDRAANVVINQHKLNVDKPMDSTYAAYFEKTIQYLQKNNIDVVLVQYPESPEFIAKKNPEGQKQYNAYIRSLTEKYHLRTIDMREYSKYGDRFFDDQDHVDRRFYKFIGKAIMQDFCSNVAKTSL